MILDEQQLIKNILTDYYFSAQKRNPRFSIRAFSKKLNVSSSALSEILRGKRKISLKKAIQYAEILNIEPKKIKQLREAFEKSGSLEQLKPSQNPLKEIVITPDRFHVMSDRKFFSVLAMLRSKNKSPESISEKLGLKINEVKSALDELVKTGVLKKNGNEYSEEERVVFRTSENFPLELMKKRRLQNNIAAKKAIESNVNGECGYFATVSLDKSKLDEIGPIVEDFMKRLSLFLRKSGSEDVFEINLDIFPWSK
ncbi:MAG: TIGR02147 family protein [Bacteriovorax sp.]|nr:TIGR02147 family protein [Bacteriovorax sp.]